MSPGVWVDKGGHGDPDNAIVTGGQCRMGVRSGNWVVDIELQLGGFITDTENTSWKCVHEINNYWVSRYPSALVLTVVDNTSIKLDWTNNGNADYTEVSIERSSVGGTPVEIDTVVAGLATFTNTELTANHYTYRLRYRKGTTSYSAYCTAVANEWSLKMYDVNTWNISDFLNESSMTKNVSNQTSSVAVLFGANNPLVQAGADNIKPVWSAEGLTFDGVRQFIQAVAALNQPTWVYLCLKQITFTDNDYIIDGITLTTGSVNQKTTSPNLVMFAGGTYSLPNTQLAVNTLGIMRMLYNSTASKFQINNGIETRGLTGTNNMGGISLGRPGSYDGAYSHILVKGILVRTILDNIYDVQDFYNDFNTKYSVGAPETFPSGPAFDNGKVVFEFDDGRDSQYDLGFPIFTAQGISVSIMIHGSVVGTAGYVTWAELQEMNTAGINIECHNYADQYMHLLSSAAIITALNNNTTAFTTNSLPAPTEITFPNNYYSKESLEATAGLRNSNVARVVTPATLDSYIPNYKGTNPLLLSAVATDGISDAEVILMKALMDATLLNKSALIIINHSITVDGVGMSIKTTRLNELIDYAQLIGLDIDTRKQLYTAMIS